MMMRNHFTYNLGSADKPKTSALKWATEVNSHFIVCVPTIVRLQRESEDERFKSIRFGFLEKSFK